MDTALRFSEGRTTTLVTAHHNTFTRSIQPYDSTLRFNKIVSSRDSDPSSFIYSIDPSAFLKVLESDQLKDIITITLAGCPVRNNGVGLWDTLFDSSVKHSMSACVLTAQKDYTPIPQNRTVVASQFLNFSMPVSRVHLSEIVVGDKIGIAINDLTQQLTYILLYTVDERCSVTSTVRNDEGRTSLIPAINLRMEHAIRMDYEGSATVVDIDEDHPMDPLAVPFMTWLADTAYDVSQSYPWKPHFIPSIPESFNRELIEERLEKEAPQAKEVSYSDFEQACRNLYQSFKQQRPAAPVAARRRPKAKTRGDVRIPLPRMEVITFANSFRVKLENDEIYAFSKESLGYQNVSETFLMNKDLENIVIEESPKVLILSPSKFGENAYLRYFTLSF